MAFSLTHSHCVFANKELNLKYSETILHDLKNGIFAFANMKIIHWKTIRYIVKVVQYSLGSLQD